MKPWATGLSCSSWAAEVVSDVEYHDCSALKLPGHLRFEDNEYLDVPGRKLGSMVIGSTGYFTDPYKWGMNWGYNPCSNH